MPRAQLIRLSNELIGWALKDKQHHKYIGNEIRNSIHDYTTENSYLKFKSLDIQ